MASVIVAGDTSGSITISAPSVAGSTVLTLPVIATDTLAGIAATQTLTNKTLTSPVLTTPALGTPASGVLTNCTGVVAGALPAGSVLQVVSATATANVSNSTSTFTDTGLTATITPTKNTSKILVLMSHAGCGKETGNTALQIKVLRGATQIVYLEDIAGHNNTATANMIGSISVNYLDSPATTSATTYKSQFASRTNVAVALVNNYGSVPPTSTITLMEIAG